MNSNRKNISVVSTLTAATILGGALADAAHAQTNSNPQQAPSFLKQAGQKLFEGAQKQMLRKVNDTIQSQPNTQPSPDPLGASTSTSAQRQPAPCRSWVNPQERPTACLLCIHGLGLQSNSYEFFGNEQSKRGLAVYAIDVRGFGSWMKAQGKTKVNFDDCLLDIKQALESIRAANPGLPVYILGESMGGAIALRAASMYPDLIDGLISSVPAGERFNQGKTSMKVFLNLLSGFDITNVGGDVLNSATKNAKLQAKWAGDPLARLNLTPQELIQFQDFMNSNHEAAKKLSDMPVLFVQGNGDQLVKPEGTWELFNSVASKDKSFFAVPGEHLIFEEAQTQDPGPRDQNLRVISSWLTTKVGRRARRGGGMYRASTPGGTYGGGSGGAYSGGPSGVFSGAGPYDRINTQGLEVPVQMMSSGQYTEAIAELERLAVLRPNDANVLALLGRAYYQSGRPDKAGYIFRRAMRMSRMGGDQAQAFNSYLLDMSRQAQSGGGNQYSTTQSATAYPFAGFGGTSFGGATGAGSSWNSAAAGAVSPAGKGKVYAFYAKWAEQCKGVGDILNQISSLYGDRVDIMRVDIEDAMSDPLVEQYKVGPIPTVVFVAPNGQVSSTIIGESNYTNYEAAAKSIAQPFRGMR